MSRSTAWRLDQRLALTLAVILLTALACSLPFMPDGESTPTPTVAPSPTPRADLPPAVVAVSPAPGAELPLGGSLEITFNQPMQQTAVEAAWSSEPSVPGRFAWRAADRLSFTPDQPYQPSQNLTFRIGSAAQAANGIGLRQEVVLTYQTAGLLRLTQPLPAPESIEVDPAAPVIASFNRPVVPLGGDPSANPPAFTLNPAASGQGQWLNTSTYIFTPDPPLQGGMVYTVQVDPSLAALNGGPLEGAQTAYDPAAPDQPFGAWSFTTAPPRLLETIPAHRTEIGPQEAIQLVFNQPMDEQSLASAIRLTSPNGDLAWNGAWDGQTNTYSVTPAMELERGSAVNLEVGAGARARSGAPLEPVMVFSYPVYMPLSILASTPGQGGLKTQYAGVDLSVSVPLPAGDLAEYVSIEPQVSGINAYYNDYGQELWVNAWFDPSATYTLTVSADLPDAFGGRLGEPFTLSFGTEPLRPEVRINSSLYNVVYVRPADGGLPAQALNLNSLGITSGAVPLADFLFAMSGFNYYEAIQNLNPPDSVSSQTTFDLPLNQRQEVTLALGPQGSLPTGIYVVRVQSTQIDFLPGPYLVVVSDINLVLKASDGGALVWAVRMSDNQPVSGLPISLYNEEGQLIAQGQTGAQGLYQASYDPFGQSGPVRIAIAGAPGEAGFAVAMTDWLGGLSAWEFGYAADFDPQDTQTYLYSDRPIYRPGDTVYFRGLVSQVYNGRYTPYQPDQAPQLALYDGEGNELQTEQYSVNQFGSFNGQINLPEDAAPGWYALRDPDNYFIALSFQVAEYRKPEIDVSVQTAAEAVTGGTTQTFEIEARYYFDAPASNVDVAWSLYTQHPHIDLPGYTVNVLDWRWLDSYGFFSDPIWHSQSGSGVTDEQGKLTLNLDLPEQTGIVRYILEATLTDESGFPVSARTEVLAHPGDLLIGLRARAWGGEAGAPQTFDVVSVDWDANPVGNQALTATLDKVTWNTSIIDHEFKVLEPLFTTVEQTSATTNANGQAQITLTPPDPGTYRLAVTSGGSRSEILIWVGGAGQAAWPDLSNNRLRITADRTSLDPGQAASLFLPNPFGEPSIALMTVERGDVLRQEVLLLPAAGQSYVLPVSDEDAPNVYVSLTVLNGTRFRYGLLRLDVAPQALLLDATLTIDPGSARPGETVTANLSVRDANGNPVQGEFSLAIVDKAVLALADPTVPDIIEAFYGTQPLSVQTGLSLSVYAGRFIESLGRGGGGGDESLVPSVRDDLRDAAYWNPAIVTSASGQAALQIQLPENLTTWVADLRGLDAQSRVGQTTVEIVVTQPLLIRPELPRFLTAGDHLELAAIVQNTTPNDLDVQVSLDIDGFRLDDPNAATQRFSLPANSRVRVTWPGVVEELPAVQVIFRAQAGDLGDAINPGPIPVQRYFAPQSFTTSGLLSEPGAWLEVISLPPEADPARGQLTLELSPSLAQVALSALTAETVPFDNPETQASRILAGMSLLQSVQQFGLQMPGVRAEVQAALEEDLPRLLSAQNEDGGWPWWPGGQSYPDVTALVTWSLSSLQDGSDARVVTALENGKAYLGSTLEAIQPDASSGRLDSLAWRMFVLNQFDIPTSSLQSELYSLQQRLSPAGRAWLLLTYPSGSLEANQLLNDLQQSAGRLSSGAYWHATQDGMSLRRTDAFHTAVALYAIAGRQPASTLIGDATRYLVSARGRDDAWSNPFETAWAVLALTRSMQALGDPGSSAPFSATLNGAPFAQSASGASLLDPVTAVSPVSQLYADAPNALELVHGQGSGRLAYRVALQSYLPVAELAPQNHGLTVERRYALIDCADPVCPAIAGGQRGQLLQVRLSITAPQDVYFAVVEDHLPAGAEALDPSLLTTQTILPPGGYDGLSWWWFNTPRIRDDGVRWTSDYLPAGSYELVYTIILVHPGDFQVIPAQTYAYYFPELQGSSAGLLFTVTP